MVLAICAHTMLAIGHLPAEGLAACRQALSANPNNVSVQLLAGICNMLAGDLDLAEACGRRAAQLSPGAPEAYEGLAVTGFSLFLKGEDEAAIEWLEKSRAAFVDWPPTMWMLAAAQAQLGRIEEAGRTLRRLLELAPHTTLRGVGVIRARGDQRLDRLLDGLRKAGLS